MVLPCSADALLLAIPGVAYVVDRDGLILGFSRGPFLPDPVDAPSGSWECGMAIGRSLFSMIDGEAVRESYRALHTAVCSGRRDRIGFTYRCDAPDVERRMLMSISRIELNATTAAALYQSLILSETPRAPMPLFDREMSSLRFAAGGRQQPVTLCSYCQRVAWPLHAKPLERRWIEAAEFYRLGGPSDAPVSHGICESCYQRIVEPTLEAGTPKH